MKAYEFIHRPFHFLACWGQTKSSLETLETD